MSARPNHIAEPHAACGKRQQRVFSGRSGIDERLLDYLEPERGGTFVEAGAFDGVTERNTLVLERDFGWTGLLVEPVPRPAAACREARRAATVAEVALVSDAYGGTTIPIRAGGRHSLVRGARDTVEDEEDWVTRGSVLHGDADDGSISVRALTLSDLLVEAEIDSVDFLSLDVEGFEPEVLRGLQTPRFLPTYILVEVWAATAPVIAELLHGHYDHVAVLGYLERQTAADVGLLAGAVWECLYQARY